MNVITVDLVATGARVAVVVARFNQFITNSLLQGALDTLIRVGQVAENDILVVWVPGAYELPLVVQELADTKKYDAVIALGAVIRGSTTHFKYIAGECSSGLARVALQQKIPITFGVLTTENNEQGIERAGGKSGNKGVEAAMAALEMINVLKTISHG